MFKKFILIFYLLFPLILIAQSGVKGYIKDQNDKPLPYTTIYISELHSGTVANQDGYYEVRLKPGEYHLNYQILGFKTEKKTITISNQMLVMNVKMMNQSFNLKEININASSEDPAYSIMRKVVAKSKYHTMLVKSYKARIYIKGFMKVDVPKLIYAMGKKEGLDTVEVNTSESLNDIEYEYPNTYRQKVISARSNEGDSAMGGVNPYITGSFYSNSLFSGSTFGVYRFKLENSFTDQGYEIYKIKVFPRSKGPDLYTGYVYIIKDLWAIHSLNLEIFRMGFKYNISQIYTPVKDKIWMPISHNFDVKGKFFGVKVTYKYLATVSDYQVELNTNLDKKNLIVIDEKTEKEYAAALKEEKRLRATNEPKDTTKTAAETTEKFTLKDLKKAMKEMEKKEKESAKKKDEPEFRSDYSINFDTTAFKKKETYWDSIRPIPLTEIEKKTGPAKRIDSIHQARKADTTDKVAGFLGKTLGSILLGKDIRLYKKLTLKYPSPLAHFNFNTVEGFNLNLPIEIRYRKKRDNYLSLIETVRYGFSSKDFYHQTELKYEFTTLKYNQKAYLSAEGGHYISQFNSNEPIEAFINTMSSLYWVDNYMKLFQKDYAAINLSYPLLSNLKLNARLEWQKRSELFNTSATTWVSKDGKEYTDNLPVNIETNNTSFAQHKATLADITLTYKPNVSYYRHNGIIEVDDETYPALKLNYSGGFKNIFGSSVDYHRLEASIRHRFHGVRRDFDFNIFIGNTFTRNSYSFMDYKHFDGNLTILQTASPSSAFYLLDYYKYSTMDKYIGVNSQLSFRKFLLTQNMWLNLLGVRENFIFNYLKTPSSPNYVEVGYGLDNILKVLKLQAITSFENGKYKSFGFRIGLSLLFDGEE